MAIKFQYNKTSLTNLGKQLKVRRNALPTLKNKESALRVSVSAAKAEAERLEKAVTEALASYDYLAALWNEFEPGLIRITDIHLKTVKVAGVKIPQLDGIDYELKPFNAFTKTAWLIIPSMPKTALAGWTSPTRNLPKKPKPTSTSM